MGNKSTNFEAARVDVNMEKAASKSQESLRSRTEDLVPEDWPGSVLMYDHPDLKMKCISRALEDRTGSQLTKLYEHWRDIDDENGLTELVISTWCIREFVIDMLRGVEVGVGDGKEGPYGAEIKEERIRRNKEEEERIGRRRSLIDEIKSIMWIEDYPCMGFNNIYIIPKFKRIVEIFPPGHYVHLINSYSLYDIFNMFIFYITNVNDMVLIDGESIPRSMKGSLDKLPKDMQDTAVISLRNVFATCFSFSEILPQCDPLGTPPASAPS